MPSFAAAMSADQMWDVVHYIRTLNVSKAHSRAGMNPKGSD
jgi:mono/diheme cytochrome c family protein